MEETIDAIIYDKDISINLELLYYANKVLKNNLSNFETLKNCVYNVDLSRVYLENTADYLVEVQKSCDLIYFCYTSILEKVNNTYSYFKDNDPNAYLLFTYMDDALCDYEFDYSNGFTYLFDYLWLLGIYSGGLPELSKSNGPSYIPLYDYFKKLDKNGVKFDANSYVNKMMGFIQSNFSGREAAVNSVLFVLSLAASKGVMLDYNNKGTNSSSIEISTEDVLSGIACNGFVSWAIAQGCGDTFQWRSVEGFRGDEAGVEAGPQIELSVAQPGDIFVNDLASGGEGGHVGFIVANDPVNKVFVVAHARSDGKGVVLETKSYDYFNTNDYHVRDMGQFYN